MLTHLENILISALHYRVLIHEAVHDAFVAKIKVRNNLSFSSLKPLVKDYAFRQQWRPSRYSVMEWRQGSPKDLSPTSHNIGNHRTI